jgi:hypothetical protein
MKHRSLNFLVKTAQAFDGKHPRGEAFADQIQARIAATHSITQPIDNWRDCGWEFCFAANGEEYSVVVSVLEDDSTLLLLCPRRLPNFLTRLFGSLLSATDEGMERRREEVADLLRNDPQIQAVAFEYDGMPKF